MEIRLKMEKDYLGILKEMGASEWMTKCTYINVQQ